MSERYAPDASEKRHFATYDLLYNFRTQQNQTVYNADKMDDETALTFIPDTPRAIRIYNTARTEYLKTPYEAMRMTVEIIMNGVQHGETAEHPATGKQG